MRGHRIIGSTTLGALAAGTLLSAGLAGAPSANATCASFWGIGNSADCNSTIGTVAVAIGTNAKATANGLFGTAFAIGANAEATNIGGFNFATAVGDNAIAVTNGFFNIATQLGANGETFTAGTTLGLGFNFALNVSLGSTSYSTAQAVGIGNLAVNLFGDGTGVMTSNNVAATGITSTAINLGGQNNNVLANGGTSGAFNTGFNILGSGNDVGAGTGPFAIAGAILQTDKIVTKVGPGININGFKVGGASAVNARKAAPGAAAKPSATSSSKRDSKPTGGAKRAKRSAN